MVEALTHLSLFSGIGGIDLAAEWAGFESVGQCEWADYPTKVLEKHWPDVPRWRDVRSVTADSFIERTGMDTVDLVSGGYPCQPFSLAGKQLGKDDDRYLWPEMCRIIRELRPRWVLGENVAGHIRNGLDDVLRDLESESYSTRTYVVQAQAVGALHRRERVFVVAHSNLQRQQECDVSTKSAESRPTCWRSDATDVAYASKESDEQTYSRTRTKRVEWESWNDVGRSYWERRPEPPWSVPKSELGRMADGVSNGLDALGCLGNAVVPQQVYPILKAIADIERGERT